MKPDYAMWKPPFRYDPDGTFITNADNHIIVNVRGWGWLIGKGSGGLGLDEREAVKVQDEFGHRIADLLNKDAEEKGEG